MNVKNIVVGIDFSASAKVALETAAKLADVWNANLHVIHIINSEFFDCELSEKVVTRDLVESKGYSRLSAFCLVTLKEPPPYELYAMMGHPFYKLLHQAQELNADMIVLGSHGESGKSDRVGTIAARFVRKARMPVLLVREGRHTRFEKVIACCDFSQPSLQAVEHAAAMAMAFGTSLKVVHVHVPYPGLMVGIYGEVPMLGEDFYAERLAELEKELVEFLDPLRRSFPSLNIESVIVQKPSGAAGICEFLKEERAELAVVGTRGRTGFKSLLLGTTAERVIHQCPCSVLAVKPADYSYEA